MPDVANTWIQVRVKRETHARLDAFRRRLLAAFESGRLRTNGQLPDAEMADGISIDGLISRLLDQHQRHAERRRRQLDRRKAAGNS